MKYPDPSEEEISRVLALIYGPPASGKTLSSIITLPKPLFYIQCEPKSVKQTCKGHIDIVKLQKEGLFKVGKPESYEDLFNTLTGDFDEICETYKSVLFDGLSFFMGVDLLGELMIETGKAKVFDSNRPLLNDARTDPAGYGGLASLMNRMCGVIGKIASEGPVVVITAQQKEDPKWNRELSAGPALSGKKFGEDMPGFFDLIGMVEKREQVNKKTGAKRVKWPPKVWFESPADEAFTARWSGPALKEPFFELDWKKILSYEG
jgi:hypothetical protein